MLRGIGQIRKFAITHIYNVRRNKVLLRVVIFISLFALQSVAGSADETVARYFPDGAWGGSPRFWTSEEMTKHYEKRYGGILAAMKEPSLAVGDSFERGPDEIRLLFLPTFDPGTMLRISHSDGQEVSYEFKKLSGASGFEPGDLIVHSTGTVEKEDADRIFALLEAINIWSDAVPPILDIDARCFDGTQTVLEFRKGNDYKVIQRHNCDLLANDNIRKLIHAFDDVSVGQLITPSTFEPLPYDPAEMAELDEKVKVIPAPHPMENLDGAEFRKLCVGDDQSVTMAYVIGMLDMIDALRDSGTINTNICLPDYVYSVYVPFCRELISRPEEQEKRAAAAFLGIVERFKCLESSEPAISRPTSR